jgi:hypothetical protein
MKRTGRENSPKLGLRGVNSQWLRGPATSVVCTLTMRFFEIGTAAAKACTDLAADADLRSQHENRQDAKPLADIEHQTSNLGVAGSSPAGRTNKSMS